MREGIYIVYLKEGVAKQLGIKSLFIHAYFNLNNDEFECDGAVFCIEDCIYISPLLPHQGVKSLDPNKPTRKGPKINPHHTTPPHKEGQRTRRETHHTPAERREETRKGEQSRPEDATQGGGKDCY